MPSTSSMRTELMPSDRDPSQRVMPSHKHQNLASRSTSHPQNVSLQVKFLHKIIQEWFAAIHFSSMLKQSKGKNRHRIFLNKHLPLINPADLHYVLRFTSYLCPDSCHLIMEHLYSCYKKGWSCSRIHTELYLSVLCRI